MSNEACNEHLQPYDHHDYEVQIDDQEIIYDQIRKREKEIKSKVKHTY